MRKQWPARQSTSSTTQPVHVHPKEVICFITATTITCSGLVVYVADMIRKLRCTLVSHATDIVPQVQTRDRRRVQSYDVQVDIRNWRLCRPERYCMYFKRWNSIARKPRDHLWPGWTVSPPFPVVSPEANLFKQRCVYRLEQRTSALLPLRGYGRRSGRRKLSVWLERSGMVERMADSVDGIS